MTALELVIGRLRERGIRHAVIGAGALAVYGVSRATQDLDLLALDPACLRPETWHELDDQGIEVKIRRGDATDPLAGVVRFHPREGDDLDLVIGRGGWQLGVLERARELTMDSLTLPVVTAADLILLKLYTGGSQDAWDVSRLLEDDPSGERAAQVEERLGQLPARCRRLWARIVHPEEA